MKILFIYPNINAQEGFNHGIAAMSGCLKQAGHETDLINLNQSAGEMLTNSEIAERLAQFQPNILAFSVQTLQYKYAVAIAEYLREEGVDIPFVFGGVHATMVPEEVQADGHFDYIGVGECDEAIVELVDKLERGEDPSKILNFRVRKPDGTWQVNHLRHYPSLVELPPKDYDIFNLDKMLTSKNGWLSILTSRGCPYRCSYCFNHEVTDRYLEEGGHRRKSYLRHYSVERMIGELTMLYERYGDKIKMFVIDDDLFTLNRSYVIDFCRAYEKTGITTPFVVNAHVQTMREDAAQALSEAGCAIVKFGVESGDETIRKKYLERRMTNDAIDKAFQVCHKYGLHTSAFLMLGVPYEGEEELWNTIRLMARIRPGRFKWSIFFPFVGTQSYTLCREGDLIDEAKMKALDNYYDYSCLKFSPEMDLFVRKVSAAFPWYVNALADLEVSPTYQALVDEIQGLDLKQWEERKKSVPQEDRELSNRFLAQDKFHYSLRFLRVMAVDSNYVKREARERAGSQEWRTAGDCEPLSVSS